MRRLVVVLTLAVLAGCSSAPERGPSLAAAPAQPLAEVAPTVSAKAYAAIVVDMRTGKVLHQDGAQSLRYPASLTKMMTLYLLFDQLQAGRLTTASALTVSESAASRPPAKLGVKAGTTITWTRPPGRWPCARPTMWPLWWPKTLQALSPNLPR
ncbi:MAG: hypothetical protein AAFW98_19340 [Pseudomonadota bacterium]